jgi:hypothetical protein
MCICLLPLYAALEFKLHAYCVICAQPNNVAIAVTIFLWQSNLYLQDRRQVYSILEGEGIEIPRYAVLDRDSPNPKRE